MSCCGVEHTTTKVEESLRVKLIVVGQCSVGKSALIRRFVEQRFQTGCHCGCAPDFLSKEVNEGNAKFMLHIWDTVGLERFDAISPWFYRDARAAIVVYDITNAGSFENAKTWFQTILISCADESKLDTPPLIVALVGTKLDRQQERTVSTEVLRFHFVAFVFSF
jgi:Ras-related protein Rab-5C